MVHRYERHPAALRRRNLAVADRYRARSPALGRALVAARNVPLLPGDLSTLLVQRYSYVVGSFTGRSPACCLARCGVHVVTSEGEATVSVLVLLPELRYMQRYTAIAWLSDKRERRIALICVRGCLQ